LLRCSARRPDGLMTDPQGNRRGAVGLDEVRASVLGSARPTGVDGAIDDDRPSQGACQTWRSVPEGPLELDFRGRQNPPDELGRGR